jgi:hypothetical protein
VPGPSDDVAAGYAELLAREPWHWFATLTFSPTKRVFDRCSGKQRVVDRFHPIRGMHLEAADKAFRWWLRQINENLYGKRWMRSPGGGLVWARGQEFHKSGRVHFHAVLAAPDGDLNKLASRYHWHELWFKEFGRNQIERPRDQDEVVGYVSKYVAKDGEVDFSQNFGKQHPPRLFDAVQDRTAGVLRKPALADVHRPTRAGPEAAGSGALLSLTLPVRPEFAQQRFTDETFYEPDLREQP